MKSITLYLLIRPFALVLDIFLPLYFLLLVVKDFPGARWGPTGSYTEGRELLNKALGLGLPRAAVVAACFICIRRRVLVADETMQLYNTFDDFNAYLYIYSVRHCPQCTPREPFGRFFPLQGLANKV